LVAVEVVVYVKKSHLFHHLDHVHRDRLASVAEDL
jgi:hypothetical protein